MDQTEIVSSAEGYVVRFTGGGRFAAEDITFRHEGEAMADVVTVLGGEVVFIRCRFTGAVYVEGAGNRAGLRLRQGASGLVRECVVVDNDNTGILVENRALPMLDRNICTRNGVVGIGYVDEAGGVARENQCSENAVGIGVSNDARPTLERNVCRDNEYHGIAFWDSASGTAYRNECVGNGVGIFVGETANPDLVENNCYDNAEEDVHDLRP
jgi:parallel beta-helix repeat protein